MKQRIFYGLVAVLCLVGVSHLDARGGGGRGGGRSSGRSVSHTPSMSRAVPARQTPQRQVKKAAPAYKAPQRQVQKAAPQINRQNRPGTTPTVTAPQVNPRNVNEGARNAATRNQSQRFFDQRQGNMPISRPSETPRNWGNVGTKVRNDIGRDRPQRDNWFRSDFWDRHDYHPPYAYYHDNWWQPATAVGIGAWLGWNTAPSYVYYSGDGYYTSPYTGYVAPAAPPPSAIAQGLPPEDAWMPLGVFAISKEADTEATPHFYLQLALNKKGMIMGAFYNSATDMTYPVEGSVDPNTQRAAWRIAGTDTSPIVETGLYNLTQQETPARLFFYDGRTKDIMLVRLQ